MSNKINTLGKLIHYDFNTNIASFQFDFVDINLQEQIESLLNFTKPIKLSFVKVKKLRSKTEQQQRKFWVDFYKIMKELKISITKDNKAELYDFVKKNIFPARKSSFIRNDNNEIIDNYYVPEMKDLSIEEMNKVIEDLHYYYSYLNIKWENNE